MSEVVSDQNRRTPPWLFELLQKHVKTKFKIDAAATKKNALCKRFFTEKEDGLLQHWDEDTFCNPPYKYFRNWIEKAYHEANEREIITCLIGPKGCSQRWYHDYAKRGSIYAPDDRLVFNDSVTGEPTGGAREDSMIYILGPGWMNKDTTRFRYYPLSVRGMVVTL
jgi:phage N-6-adenine-methyltransferase